MTKEQFNAYADSYTDLLRNEADLHMLRDDSGFALGTWVEPSVGIFGGPVTPFFETEADLESYCADVLLDRIPSANLDEYLIACLDQIKVDFGIAYTCDDCGVYMSANQRLCDDCWNLESADGVLIQ